MFTRSTVKWLCLSLLTLTTIMVSFVPIAQAQQIVREIRVNGVQRIEPTTVLNYLGVSVGQEIDETGLNAALKDLYGTGLFADVSLRQDAGILFVDVTENPIISQIAFEGNDEIKDEELLAEISLRPRQVFTRTKVQNDVTRIYEVYRRTGRFAANVEPKIIKLDQNRINVVFEVAEGEITKIRGIRFVGNQAFDNDTLRSELSSKENRWYRFLSSDDRYDPDRIKYDEELLRRFYLKEGYADFRVVTSNAELAADKKDFFLTFTVEEGERYKIGSVAIDSQLRGFDGEVLRDTVTFVPGQWYNADEVQTTVDNMTDKLGDLQYAFVNIRPAVERNLDQDTVDIRFNIGESPRVFVERIDVKGNVRTLDKVVRREMLLVEGDPFNRSKLSRSEQRLRNLDFFENVSVKTRQGSAPDRTIIDVDVTEKSTGEISVGAGFSTNDGPLADLRIRERNLLGKGQDLLFSTTIAGERTEFNTSFTEPYFLNRDVSAGFDVYHSTSDFQDERSFNQRNSGGALRVGYPLSEKWRQSLRYRYDRNEITDVEADASRFVRDQEGTRNTSALSQRLTYDDRDSILFPTEGLYSWLDNEVAGLGGNAKYVSGKLGSNYYIPVYKRSVIFNVLGEVAGIAGYGDEDVQINERFFLGGNTLRGFERSGVGPRDSITDDALGGNFYYRGSVELGFPIGLPEELGVKGHVFTDFGSLYDIDETGPEILDESSIRASAGVGLSWRSPLGPLRVDFAVPYAKEDYDEEEAFRFSFGTRF
ncbi:MAG: outer membrane protein assembly factor BamA [Alphaproteobacteria bacterium]|nr:outer membrane protein assembly factor BamA [Alphaproteobacteria bacterium]NCQ88070.1 outer membrane protein assembly factor BamA [Alphaproteobacteria bacterium]NCT05423.1 outer membrane protein assembly factor BamA [Alphaproteobacteria bacterium]